MQEDINYLFFYPGSGGTFAPAAMVNRHTYANISSSPIVQATSTNNVLSTIYNAATTKPYVSFNLETKLNESTRELKVKVQILAHTDAPSKQSIFNLFLVQDGIIASQTNAGENYTHNHTFRGTVTRQRMGYARE